MKPKIKITENGYCISDDWLYLDEKEYKTGFKVSFGEFSVKFHTPIKYDWEWKGNNPFSVSSVKRFWLENERCCVEIAVHEYTDGSHISIYKCFLCDKYDSSTELIRDITDLDELFIDLRGEVERVIKEMESEE